MGFTKLDSGIIDSSIWDEESDVLKVFIAFWTKCNSEGVVDATYNAMFRTANLCDDKKNPLPITNFESALNILLNPDPSSRSKENDGRRIIRLEESKWLVTTYKKNREHTYSDNPEAIKKRKQRGTLGDMSQTVPGHSVSVSASFIDLNEEDCKGKQKRNIIPPKIEWITEYCNERENNIIPQKFFDYYQSRGWMIGKNKLKDWQAAVRTWENSGYNNTKPTNNKDQEEEISWI